MVDQVPGFLQKFSSPDSRPGLSWVRLTYWTCGNTNHFPALVSTINNYHAHGIRVLLLICHGDLQSIRKDLGTTSSLLSVLDAVQCGNEEETQNTPAAITNFVEFYNYCETTAHSVRSDIPVLLGAFTPQVVDSPDGQAHLQAQIGYLNSLQIAMRLLPSQTEWDWHQQRVGLVDSWHNGYPDPNDNNLLDLFNYWAGMFQVSLSDLGKHLWVTEGSGCFQGCNIDVNSSYQVAVSHILTLITDVQTAKQYAVPFFYFSSKDFVQYEHKHNVFYPMGVLDSDGNPKPLRSDLGAASPTLMLSCSGSKVSVSDQARLLTDLYHDCTLPSNYQNILTK